MQPVKFLSDIQQSLGSWGYSALVTPFLGIGAPERKTLYLVKDPDGWTKRVLILDAKEAF